MNTWVQVYVLDMSSVMECVRERFASPLRTVRVLSEFRTSMCVDPSEQPVGKTAAFDTLNTFFAQIAGGAAKQSHSDYWGYLCSCWIPPLHVIVLSTNGKLFKIRI